MLKILYYLKSLFSVASATVGFGAKLPIFASNLHD